VRATVAWRVTMDMTSLVILLSQAFSILDSYTVRLELQTIIMYLTYNIHM